MVCNLHESYGNLGRGNQSPFKAVPSKLLVERAVDKSEAIDNQHHMGNAERLLVVQHAAAGTWQPFWHGGHGKRSMQ